MAVTVERLIATLEARIDKYEKNLAKAYGQTDRQFTRIERRGKAMERRMQAIGSGLGRSFANFGRGMVAALAAGLSVRAMKNFSDAATRIDNSLKVAGLSGENLEKVYAQLRDSATKNAAPIETLVELYSRASMAAGNLGASQEDLVKFTDNVAVALRVSGKSATESAGALLQLAQLMSGSVVQAQEYNSLIDGAYPLLQAVAAGLKEAGGDVGKLTQLVKSGQVPTKAFFDAFQAGAPVLEEKVAGATFTLDQAVGNLNTALIDVAREFNASTGASERFAGGINSAAQAIAEFDVSGFISELQRAYVALDQFLDQVGNADVFTRLNQFFGLMDSEGNVINLDTKEAQEKALALEREVLLLQQTIAKNTELGFDNSAAIARLNEVSAQLAKVRAEAAGIQQLADVPGLRQPGEGPLTRGRGRTAPTELPTVSLSNYAAPKKSGGGGGGRGRGGGRGGKSNLEREIERVKEHTAAIQAETAALAGVNPLVEDYGFALEKARTKQDLLSAAQRAGVKITPELQAKIEELATGYANASAAADQLAESQDKARQMAEDIRDLGRDVMGGFIKDLADGKSAADALSAALGKIGDKLLDMALDGLFSGGGLFGGGGGGLLGGLLIPGILHDGGVVGRDGYGHGRSVSPSVFAGARRMHSGGVAGLRSGEVPAILQRGEVVLPKGIKSAGANPQNLHVTVGVSSDNNGNLMPFVESVSQRTAGRTLQTGLSHYDKQLPGRIGEVMERNG